MLPQYWRSVDAGYLILHHNQFNGTLPEELRLRQLFYLDLSNNHFEGSIAHIDWPNLFPSIRVLYLGYNKFSGELPESFPLMGNGHMKLVFLQGNNFTGAFPTKGWSDYHLSTFWIFVCSRRVPTDGIVIVAHFFGRSSPWFRQPTWTLPTTALRVRKTCAN